MSNFPALEVVIGLTFVYFVLSLICSAATESLASALGWRAAKLEQGVQNLLSVSDSVTTEGVELAERVYKHPLIQALVKPTDGKKAAAAKGAGAKAAGGAAAGKRPWPSYIPSRTFVSALLDIASSDLAAKTPAPTTEQASATEPAPAADDAAAAELTKAEDVLRKTIDAIPSPNVRRALHALANEANGDLVKFRRSAEQWFDDSMQRVSGWYRRHIQIVLWCLGLLVVVLLNVDTLQIGNTLWKDPATRAALVARADKLAQQGKGQATVNDAVSGLEIPLGWKLFELGKQPQDIPNDATGIIAKIVGLLLTVAALTLGAPFWYDLLSRFVRVSGTGPRPPTADQRAAAGP